VRSLVVFFVGILVANSIPGYAVHTPPPISPDTATYCVRQGGLAYAVQPVERSQGVASWYNYFSDSSHDPFVEAYASVLYLYFDTSAGRLYLVFHFNIDAGGTPDGQTDVTIVGVPGGAGAVVSDDPGEFSTARFPQGQFHYFLNTDGGVLGPLPTASSWQLNVTENHFGQDPIRTQKWVDGNTTRLSLAMTGTIYVTTASCNQAPTANAGGPYTGTEGSPITFNAGGSSDPDGDSLTYTWDFQNDGVDDVTTTNVTVQHTYPDDFAGKARLSVSDGTATSAVTVDVTVANVAPTITFESVSRALEGSDLVVEFRVTDPGTDSVLVSFEAGDLSAPVVVGSLWNPQDVPMTESHVYGDDGTYSIRLVAADDDGGNTTLEGILAVVDNGPPTLLAGVFPPDTPEGGTAIVAATAQDPGSDDLTFSIDFGNGDVQSSTTYNNGVGPDPPRSPGGIFPFVASASFSTVYTQNADYDAILSVTDDDGGSLTIPFVVHVYNVAPTILPFGPGGSFEGNSNSLTATATDPGNDALTFRWEFELGPTFSETLPATGSPTTESSTATFLYGDDGSYAARLTVTDQDGASAVFETTIVISNVAPLVQINQVQRPAAFVLRVAGEKWHDVNATFFANDTILGSLAVVRTPGSPDDQAASTGEMDLALGFRYAAKVLYTPADDPVNGQPNGANPVWILVRAADGTEVRIHHTFNVEHPGTYEWDVDLTPYVAQVAIRFSATATDPGSDDLTFAWDFGDGTAVETSIAYNDGVGPDPAHSPGGTFPFTATNDVGHVFPGAGLYTIRLTVTDDDGGVTVLAMTIAILG